jgi:DNA-directed RNA polymerase specialized sigma24 family protein
MMAGSNCECLICRLEKSLVAELGEERTSQECGFLAGQSSVLSQFSNTLDLVRELHSPDNHTGSASADVLLLELLKRNSSTPLPSVWQRLLLLVFIPTIHRTASQITATFPTLARDDTSQHIVSVLLEFLGSRELGTRRSHLAFTVARKLRRQAFRWAIHESRGAAPDRAEANPVTDVEKAAADEPRYAEVVLENFFDTCEKVGWLSTEERDLLVRFKIEGVTYQELASGNGHTAEGVRHRIRRLLNRLRSLARETRWQRAPEQLELFP